jgi:vacuolar-type H+-ATPase subunit E/Vma4
MGQEADPGRLFGAIEERAGEERARIAAAAEARVREIQAGADTRIDLLKAEAGRGLDKELLAEAQRLLGEARMKARGEALQLKRRILAEAFARARTEIERLRATPACPAILKKLSAEAAAAVGEPCAVEVDREKGTVAAASPDGMRRADNSLLVRVRKVETVYESEIARALFGNQGTGG